MSEIPVPPAHDAEAVKLWRRRVREVLIARRLALDPKLRRQRGRAACARLTAALDLARDAVLGIYWPIRGEIDVRAIAQRHIAAGGCAALPVIVRKAAPLEFWRWQPGMRMAEGIWNIPVPAERELLQPDILIAPLVGYVSSGYRLGYGGGYFDRTLAAAAPRPFAIGLGYQETRLATIYPQPHDIPMNMIVTDAAVYPGTAATGRG